jgi:MFS family permease
VHIVPHATDLGISPARAAILQALIGGLPIVGRIVLGSVADRIGSRKTIITGCGLIILSLVWLLFAADTWMLYLFAVVFGLTWCTGVLSSPIIAEHFGLRAHGVIMGIVGFSYGIGAGLGPYLFGHIFDTSGSYHIAFLSDIFVAVMALFLAAAITPITQKTSVRPFADGLS